MRLDFHFNVDHRLQYACRVVRKARAANKTVLVVARDGDRLARFDAALWTFSPLDFVPHVTADSPLAAETPVLLSHDAPVAHARDVLLLLDDTAPEGFKELFERFERVIEVVSRDDEDRAQARVRFKLYRDSGLQPQVHEAAE
jgi:DNA polymerase-3 subunit chi